MSARIQLGTAPGGAPVSIDLDVLLRTRLLVQASSGGGKSWLLRRLTEQLFGNVQVIVIDPEGEFATLREKYGYVLAGKGGETPADRRSAGLLAHRLLELKASAVCDLYEMPPRERHAWVRLFLEALIDAPKKYWHGLVVIVDEAHVFAPEKGAGESEASDAMIGLATRGRKRGYCPIFATQRLGKLRKDAAAELLNVLIGQTFIDVDRKRAAEALGIAPAEQRAFFDELRLLKPGKFWALGRAITTQRTLVTVGPVATTHPEAGSSKHSAEPPPPPEKVRALLPKLADLPAESEAKARSEADLRQEITALKRELAAKPVAPAPKVERIEVPVVSEKALLKLADESIKIGERLLWLQESVKAFLARYEAAAAVSAATSALCTVQPSTPAPAVRHSLSGAGGVQRSAPASTNGREPDPEVGRGGLRRMLIALAQRGRPLTAEQLGIRAGMSSRSGTFDTYLGRARRAGWIEGERSALRITDAGVAALGGYEPLPTGRELLSHWLSEIGNAGMGRMLSAAAEAYPDTLSRTELAERAGLTGNSGTFDTYLGRLRRLELIEGRGELRASSELFE